MYGGVPAAVGCRTVRGGTLEALVRRGSRLEVEDREVPTRRSGQLLVEVRAALLSGGIDGQVVGGQAVGVIREGTGSLAAGLRVLVHPSRPCRRCAPCRAGAAELCEAARIRGRDLPGTAAEVVAVDRQEVTVLPDGLDDGIAVGTLGAYVAPVAVLEGPEPGRSKSAVVTDVDGDVGLAAAHVLARAGWEVVVLGRDPERRTAAGQVGALVGVDSSAHPHFSDATLDVTQGKGAALVVDTTGSEEVVAEALRGRALQGRVVLLGDGPERVAVPVGLSLERPLATSSHAFLPAARFLVEGPAPAALVREEISMGALGGVEAGTVDGVVVVRVGSEGLVETSDEVM